MRDYIYLYSSVYFGALIAGGAIVLAVTPASLRTARNWFFLAVLTLAVLPITFCVTMPEPFIVRAMVSGVSGATAGAFFYGILITIQAGLKSAEHPSE